MTPAEKERLRRLELATAAGFLAGMKRAIALVRAVAAEDRRKDKQVVA